jgi:hypothetical protein
MSYFPPHTSVTDLFSSGPIDSPVSKTPSGERNAITNRWFGESGLTSSFALWSFEFSPYSVSTDSHRAESRLSHLERA